MRQHLVAGNWKMFGNSARNQQLLEGIVARSGEVGAARCAVCVPFPYLSQARSILSGSAIGWISNWA